MSGKWHLLVSFHYSLPGNQPMLLTFVNNRRCIISNLPTLYLPIVYIHVYIYICITCQQLDVALWPILFGQNTQREVGRKCRVNDTTLFFRIIHYNYLSNVCLCVFLKDSTNFPSFCRWSNHEMKSCYPHTTR